MVMSFGAQIFRVNAIKTFFCVTWLKYLNMAYLNLILLHMNNQRNKFSRLFLKLCNT